MKSDMEVAIRDYWIGEAVSFIRVSLARWPRLRFTGEDIAIAMKVAGEPNPTDPRWMGIALQRAKHLDLIVESFDWQNCAIEKASTKAGHRTTVWQGG